MLFKDLIKLIVGRIEVRNHDIGYDKNLLIVEDAINLKNGSDYDEMKVVHIEAYHNSRLTIYVERV